jgi:starch phosphorylase
MARAKELSAWKNGVKQHFGDIRVESVTDDMGGPESPARVGKDVRVEALIVLGGLKPSDVLVELYYGPLDEDGQLNDGLAVPMEQAAQESDGRVRYAVNMPCLHSGMTGYTVRVMPRHEMMSNSRDMALIRWA